MVIDYVQRNRSEREFLYGTGDKLAKQEQSTEAQGLVAKQKKIGLVAKVEGGVGVREPAWVLKRG